VAGAIVGAVHWSRRLPFLAPAFFAVFAAVFLLSAVNVINSWPVLASEASTAQPLELQTGIMVATSLLLGIFTAAGLALVAGLVSAEMRGCGSATIGEHLGIGVSVGLAIAGIGAVARHAAPSVSPLWGNLGPASAFVPVIAAALGPLATYFTQTLVLLAVFDGLQRLNRRPLAWVFVGIALAGSSSIETIPSWLVIGATTGLALMIADRLVFHHHPELLPITTATLIILSTIRDGVQRMYPSSLPGSLAGATLVAITGWIWFRGTMKLHARN